ncbi:DOMON domain-containing protein, partial [candidate division WOR-3 bacterium]|nr:DOMON domain-containing protein [candidate division WOR-3 bacterium]MBD3364347.1 DOMON domain-containing protein [candidate division WOR-3 bacterium]
NGSVHFKLSAPTTGWVALGIAPTTMMKGADFIMGYVAEGNAVIADEYGNSATSHKPDTELGGEDNIQNKSGSEADGVTQISFSIPLDSGDEYDKVLEPGGSYKVIFAYGSSDDFTSYHKKKASAKIESL